MKQAWTEKWYLQMQAPTEEDPASLQERILRELSLVRREEKNPQPGEEKQSEPGKQSESEKQSEPVRIPLSLLRKAGELCPASDWKITVTLAYNGSDWELMNLEAGDTTGCCYGLCMDLGSTTMVMDLVDLRQGTVAERAAITNPQVAYGEDILTRIFYTKDRPDHRDELQQATVSGIRELMEQLKVKSGQDPFACSSLIVSGNTCMIHFLLGLDAFGVFQSPYAVQTLAPDVYRTEELGIPMHGYVFCVPGKANYLGGDITSGILHTGIGEREETSVFLDIGTNGELVIGNRYFLMGGAGAAGPALEGGSVRTGMRAEEGAVDKVLLTGGQIQVHTIGEMPPRGICGSGIVDLLAQLYLSGWLDLRGRFLPEASACIQMRDGMPAVAYAPDLYFYQSDVDEFLRTKAAAMTMVEYMRGLIGLPMEEIDRFYVAGAFGTHMDKESAVTIGLYPDMDRERILQPGNTSLLGARDVLLDTEKKREAEELLERMEYVQFGAVEDFLHLMVAALAIPHTDLGRYPSVLRELERRKKGYRN